MVFQLRDSLAGHGGNGNNRRAFECCSRKQCRDLGPNLTHAGRRHSVYFGQGDRAITNAEKIEDGQVLPGLRHRAVIGCDDEQDKVDTGNPA